MGIYVQGKTVQSMLDMLLSEHTIQAPLWILKRETYPPRIWWKK